MLALRGLALRRGARTLFADADLVVHDGWKVGVVGRNGCGKSSLLAAVRGELETDAGSIDLPADVRMASVAQETPGLPDPAIDYVLEGDREVAAALALEARARATDSPAELAAAHQRLEELHGYDARARAGRLLHGLGFAAGQHGWAVARFSGGWRARLNLARALMTPSDLLLLDEPTNHLDLDALVWLEQWLRRYPGILLVVSHDREFLDACTSHTLHLENGQARLYAGNYGAFERQRATQLHQQQRNHQREQAERAHLEAFVARFRAKATKARQAQSRIKRLQKLAGTEMVRMERPLRFQFQTPRRLPQSMLKLDTASAGYDAHHPVLRGLTRTLEAGDRIGLLGRNGAGKSTLVKTLVGELAPLAGHRDVHADLGIGYFAQHAVENLHAGESALDHLAQRAPEASTQQLRDWLGRWNFAGDRALQSVDGFSGGERARLALSLISWEQPGLLVLDEPTNHLDMDMREALADALNEYPGALVLVSHDRHLLGLACDRFWHVADGGVRDFDGDLDDYARWLRETQTAADREDAVAPSRESGEDGQVSAPTRGKDRRRAAALERERTRAARKQLRAVETGLRDIDGRLREIDQALADPEIYQGPTATLAELGREQGQLRQRKDQLENEWLELGETLEGHPA